jgi:hypothetical protein
MVLWPFSVSLIKLIVFITDKKLEVLVEGGFSTPISGKGSSRSPSLPQKCTVYTSMMLQQSETHLALFAHDVVLT